MSNSVLLKFLDNATKMPTLLQIRREIEGEIEDDSDSEGEEEDVDVERRVRHVSKTLFALLTEAGATTIGFKSDWSCFLAFLTEHIAEICELKNLEQLNSRLRQLSDLTLYSHRLLSKSLRNNFTDVIAIAKAYLMPRVNSEKFEEQIEEHWRPIVKVSADILKVQLKMKDDALYAKINHQYDLDWDTYVAALTRLSACAQKPQEDITKADAVALLCVVEANIACRKSEILDPTIRFSTFLDYQKELKRSGLPQSTTFTLGDEKEGITMDESRALAQFKSANLVVQQGRFKDASQRNLQFAEDPAEALQRTNAILRRPSLLFSAADICRMISIIRKYFKITLANRPTGPGARREIGEKYVTARDVRVHVLEKYFPSIVAHAKKFHFPLGSHFFRSAAANFLADVYQTPVRNATGSSVHRQVLMKTFLTHQGSLMSAMSYANVNTSLPMSVPELAMPTVHMLMKMQSQIDSLLKTVAAQQAQIDSIKPREECSDLIEFKRADGTLAMVPKRNDTVRHTSAAERDGAIQRAIEELEKAGVSATATNIQKCGFGPDTYKDYKEKLPLNFSASQRKCKKEKAQLAAIKGDAAPSVPPVAPHAAPPPPPAVAPRELRERGTHVSDLPTQLPYGQKVILSKPNSTANAKRQQIKRGRETFSGPENEGMTIDSDADCESGKIVTKKVKSDKGRDLEVRVCEEDRR